MHGAGWAGGRAGGQVRAAARRVARVSSTRCARAARHLGARHVTRPGSARRPSPERQQPCSSRRAHLSRRRGGGAASCGCAGARGRPPAPHPRARAAHPVDVRHQPAGIGLVEPLQLHGQILLHDVVGAARRLPVVEEVLLAGVDQVGDEALRFGAEELAEVGHEDRIVREGARELGGVLRVLLHGRRLHELRRHGTEPAAAARARALSRPLTPAPLARGPPLHGSAVDRARGLPAGAIAARPMAPHPLPALMPARTPVPAPPPTRPARAILRRRAGRSARRARARAAVRVRVTIRVHHQNHVRTP